MFFQPQPGAAARGPQRRHAHNRRHPFQQQHGLFPHGAGGMRHHPRAFAATEEEQQPEQPEQNEPEQSKPEPERAARDVDKKKERAEQRADRADSGKKPEPDWATLNEHPAELARAVCAWLMVTAPPTTKDAAARLDAGEERLARLAHTLASAGMSAGDESTEAHIDSFSAWLQANYFDGITTDQHGPEARARSRADNRLVDRLCSEQKFAELAATLTLPPPGAPAPVQQAGELEMAAALDQMEVELDQIESEQEADMKDETHDDEEEEQDKAEGEDDEASWVAVDGPESEAVDEAEVRDTGAVQTVHDDYEHVEPSPVTVTTAVETIDPAEVDVAAEPVTQEQPHSEPAEVRAPTVEEQHIASLRELLLSRGLRRDRQLARLNHLRQRRAAEEEAQAEAQAEATYRHFFGAHHHGHHNDRYRRGHVRPTSAPMRRTRYVHHPAACFQHHPHAHHHQHSPRHVMLY